MTTIAGPLFPTTVTSSLQRGLEGEVGARPEPQVMAASASKPPRPPRTSSPRTVLLTRRMSPPSHPPRQSLMQMTSKTSARRFAPAVAAAFGYTCRPTELGEGERSMRTLCGAVRRWSFVLAVVALSCPASMRPSSYADFDTSVAASDGAALKAAIVGGQKQFIYV